MSRSHYSFFRLTNMIVTMDEKLRGSCMLCNSLTPIFCSPGCLPLFSLTLSCFAASISNSKCRIKRPFCAEANVSIFYCINPENESSCRRTDGSPDGPLIIEYAYLHFSFFPPPNIYIYISTALNNHCQWWLSPKFSLLSRSRRNKRGFRFPLA